MGMVVRQGLGLALRGLVTGLAGSQWLTHVFASILFGVKPNDLLTNITVALVLAGVAIAAISIPAWRGARVDPLEALRGEQPECILEVCDRFATPTFVSKQW